MAETYGYPLSFAQRRLWFLTQLFPGSVLYNLPLVVRLSANVDPGLLQQCLNTIGRRHETLRTRFRTVDGEPVQIIEADRPLDLECNSLEHVPEAERWQVALRLAEADLRVPFDLARGPLWRVRLLHLSQGDELLVIVVHHIVADGWSMGVLSQELATIYAALAAGCDSALPELPVQYADYAIWQLEWLRSQEYRHQLRYWTEHLADVPLTELPADRPRPARGRMEGRRCHFHLRPALRYRIETLARQHDATPFMVLLAGLGVLLYRHTGQVDLPIGTPIAGRDRPEFEALIGLFVNTLVLRIRLAGLLGFASLVGQVRETVLAAYTNQELPFDRLVEELRPERNIGRNPLCQVMLTMHNAPTAIVAGAAPHGRSLDVETGAAGLDLAFDVWPEDEGWAARLEYNLDLFEPETAAELAARWVGLLEAAAAAPETAIDDLPLLSEEERRETTEESAEIDLGPPVAAHELVGAAASRAGKEIAVQSERAAWTHAELRARSARVAARLRDAGVASEASVAVLLDRSCTLVAVLLGTLESGAAYAPIDARGPSLLVAATLATLRPGAVVTSRRLAPMLPDLPAGTALVLVEEDAPASGDNGDFAAAPAVASVAAEGLAYIIQTSGTTGRPKGVMVEHRALANQLRWMQTQFPLRPEEAVLAVTSPAFDVSLWELLGPLAAGARLVLAPPGAESSPTEIVSLLLRHRIAALQTTPSILGMLIDVPALHRCEALRWVFCGGEPMPRSLAERFAAAGLAATLVNIYGPTEATIDSTFLTLQKGRAPPDTQSATVPIGGPIANVHLHVLDRRARPLPWGVTGELCVSGANLARGYLDDPALTAERFPHSPLARGGGRIYRTGDRARRLRDGSIELLGRLDRQVKLRGIRVELGAIEAALLTHPAVREAVVEAAEVGTEDATLVACVVADLAPAEAFQILRRHLAERLPAAMVPALIAAIDRLPITSTGKLDRRATLQCVRRQWAQARGPVTVPPRTDTEAGVAAIWQELLQTGPLGVDDDFFGLGGHSLLAARVMARVLDRHGVDLPLRLLFETPTIAALAAAIDRELAATPRAPIKAVAAEEAWLGPEAIPGLSDDEVELLLAAMLDRD